MVLRENKYFFFLFKTGQVELACTFSLYHTHTFFFFFFTARNAVTMPRGGQAISWPRKQKPHINRWDGGAGFGLCAADIVLPDIFVKLKFLSSHRADGCCLGGFVYLRSTQNQEWLTSAQRNLSPKALALHCCSCFNCSISFYTEFMLYPSSFTLSYYRGKIYSPCFLYYSLFFLCSSPWSHINSY